MVYFCIICQLNVLVQWYIIVNVRRATSPGRKGDTMIITMRFTSRVRYGVAIKHLWAHPERFKVLCRGRDYGAIIKTPGAECGWYIEFSQF